MNTKIMEGLVGARTNMNLTNTPMSVYKEAKRRGDTAAMERAMGYVGEFADNAKDYKAEADKGMEEDIQRAREKAKAECEKAVQKRREEEKQAEERMEEAESEAAKEPEAVKEADKAKEPVTYTKTGEVFPTEQNAKISISI